MAKHWSEILQCRCGMKFRSYASEAFHRHNYPILCRKPKKHIPKPKKDNDNEISGRTPGRDR
jgi:hypothetical protein